MSTPTPAQPAEKPTKKKSNKIRTGILVGILLIGLYAAGYEFIVARPKWESASNAVGEWVNQDLSKTIDDVQKEIGKEPSETRANGQFIMEKYEWRSGLVFRTHKLFVTYGAKARDLQRTGSEEPAGWADASPQ